ncbi:MAG: hypothetical protein JXA77_07350 [Bacteroidales bacterium]|nr:hypothetical protein [Bacteroidales bacterium]MBN2819692.1 hypothetical protein [Bacteroidales bacterium]
MKKYSFLVYHKEYFRFLEDIQGLGVVHIIEKESGEIENEELREKYLKIQQIEQTVKYLEKRQIEFQEAESKKDGLNVLAEVKDMQQDKEHYLQKLGALQKELKTLEPWGNFSWSNIDKLKEAGISVKFFTCPTRKFIEEYKESLPVEEINEINGHIYFVLFEKVGAASDLDAEELHLPDKTYNKLNEQVTEINEIIEKIDSVLDKFAAQYIPALVKTKTELSNQLSFDKVILSTTKEAEEKLMILEGWVPDDKEEDLESFLKKTGVYFESEKPTIEDKIPIKLKNNKFARLFEVIGDLYSRPSYKELDLTPYFAPFYLLFFGFCLGDAGYGLIITLAGLIMLFKAKKDSKDLFRLVSLLGVSTIIFGIIGGTFFGINLYEIRFGLYAHFADKFDAQKKSINDHLFTLSLVFGAIQIIFGMFVKILNEIKMFNWKWAIGTIGWLIIILGIISLMILSKTGVSPELLAIVKWSVIVLGFSGAFLFNNPERNIFANIGGGIWDAYNMATGIMGDLLSYIRLFALGISSAILGYVFNSLAVEFAPENIIGKILVMTIILLFGHGLNLFMAALGSFVHPVRLTFVEFYKNAGFIGGGVKYSPFNKKNSK